MNISLDKHQEGYIAHKLKAGGYLNAAEIVREALRLLEAQEDRPAPELEAAILKGLSSGPATPMPADYFARRRAKAAAKLKRRAA